MRRSDALGEAFWLAVIIVLILMLSDCDWLRPMIYCPDHWRTAF